MTLIKGNVLCAGCALDEVRQAQPGLPHLYQLTHKQGQVVLQVRTVNGSAMWEAPLSPRFAVRAKDSVFQQLTAGGESDEGSRDLRHDQEHENSGYRYGHHQRVRPPPAGGHPAHPAQWARTSPAPTFNRKERQTMKPLSQTMTVTLAVALLLASVPPLAQGRDARGGLHITGSVICAKCELNEMRSTQASAEQLYQFTHAQRLAGDARAYGE